MDSKLVSVVMPCFNSESVIGRAIDSAVRQSRSELELLVADDKSSDGTCDVVRSYMRVDDRIRLLQLKKNAGPGIARNTAIRAARGRYIAFLDSDDTWAPTKLERQIEVMHETEAVMSCTAYRMQRGDGYAKVIVPPHRLAIGAMLRGCDVGCLTVVLDLKLLGEKVYMRDIRMRQDMLLWVDVLKRGGLGIGLSDVLAELHVSHSSLSGSKRRAATYQWRAYREELGLGRVQSSWYFMWYAIHGLLKHRFGWQAG